MSEMPKHTRRNGLAHQGQACLAPLCVWSSPGYGLLNPADICLAAVLLSTNMFPEVSPLFLQAPADLARAGVQPRLITRWREVHGSSSSRCGEAGADECGAFVSSEQRAFFGLCSSWKDVLFTQRPYPTRLAP